MTIVSSVLQSLAMINVNVAPPVMSVASWKVVPIIIVDFPAEMAGVSNVGGAQHTPAEVCAMLSDD